MAKFAGTSFVPLSSGEIISNVCQLITYCMFYDMMIPSITPTNSHIRYPSHPTAVVHTTGCAVWASGQVGLAIVIFGSFIALLLVLRQVFSLGHVDSNVKCVG